MRESLATVVQWCREQPLPSFKQSKENHNENSEIVLSVFRNIQDNK